MDQRLRAAENQGEDQEAGGGPDSNWGHQEGSGPNSLGGQTGVASKTAVGTAFTSPDDSYYDGHNGSPKSR